MERSYWTDLLLVVLTLGFYMPYWIWKRNQEVREALPALGLRENAWFLGGGTALSFMGSYIALVGQPFAGSFFTIAGVLVFSVGVYLLASNGEAAATSLGLDWGMPPALFAGLFAAAFLAVEAGNIFPTLVVRVPALLMVASLPLVFYRVYEDLEDVEASSLQRAATQA